MYQLNPDSSLKPTIDSQSIHEPIIHRSPCNPNPSDRLIDHQEFGYPTLWDTFLKGYSLAGRQSILLLHHHTILNPNIYLHHQLLPIV